MAECTCCNTNRNWDSMASPAGADEVSVPPSPHALQFTQWISEQHLDPELHLARRVHRSQDLTGGLQRHLVLRRAGEHRPGRHGEIRSVEHIEYFEPELQPRVPGKRLILDERHVS